MDVLGFGHSPWPRSAEAYTVESHCDWIIAVLGSYNVEGPTILVGHSLGVSHLGSLLYRVASAH